MPEETRERILDAAMAEFGAKGYSGARTAGIAKRAGVNPQLISYYFGGKQGLLEELRRRWQEIEASIAAPDAPFGTAVTAAVNATLDRPDWARLTIWQALGDCPFADAEEGERLARARRSKVAEAVERIRRRQTAGEMTDDVGPEFALLTMYALSFAPITLPHLVEELFGADALSTTVRRRLQDQLIALLGAHDEENG